MDSAPDTGDHTTLDIGFALSAEGPAPDIAFSLNLAQANDVEQSSPPAPGGDDSEQSLAEQPANDLVHILADQAPPGWIRLDAVFSLTTTEAVAQVVYTTADRAMEAIPGDDALNLVRALRDSMASQEAGLWWRLLVGLTPQGSADIGYDYGFDQPFPEEQLLSAQAYQRDHEQYPSQRLPVWLAAYAYHGRRQERSPEHAAHRSRSEETSGVHAEIASDEFPPLSVMWARWTTLAAVFAGSGSALGPRVLPSLACFEGATYSGSTLCRLPGGQAVLSGGVWQAPALDAAYNDAAALPDLYRGAPFWVSDEVLDLRAAHGMLSFCYWWDGTSWFRGDSPHPAEFARALPGIWTADIVADLIVQRMRDREPETVLRSAAATLVTAAEQHVVQRELIAGIFGGGESETDSAYYQFVLGGLTAPVRSPIARR